MNFRSETQKKRKDRGLWANYLVKELVWVMRKEQERSKRAEPRTITEEEASLMTPVKEKLSIGRPHLVVAYPNAGYTNALSRHYRRRGWEVHTATSGDEARQLTHQWNAEAVVLGTELPDESGWLICDKLLEERPGQIVVLIANHSTQANRTFAEFVGAVALVHEEAGIQALVEEINAATLLSPAG